MCKNVTCCIRGHGRWHLGKDVKDGKKPGVQRLETTGRESSKCKGPKVGNSEACLGSIMKASLTGTYLTRRRLVGNESG